MSEKALYLVAIFYRQREGIWREASDVLVQEPCKIENKNKHCDKEIHGEPVFVFQNRHNISVTVNFVNNLVSKFWTTNVSKCFSGILPII